MYVASQDMGALKPAISHCQYLLLKSHQTSPFFGCNCSFGNILKRFDKPWRHSQWGCATLKDLCWMNGRGRNSYSLSTIFPSKVTICKTASHWFIWFLLCRFCRFISWWHGIFYIVWIWGNFGCLTHFWAWDLNCLCGKMQKGGQTFFKSVHILCWGHLFF